MTTSAASVSLSLILSLTLSSIHQQEAGFGVKEATSGFTLAFQSYDAGSLLTGFITMVTDAEQLTCSGAD